MGTRVGSVSVAAVWKNARFQCRPLLTSLGLSGTDMIVHVMPSAASSHWAECHTHTHRARTIKCVFEWESVRSGFECCWMNSMHRALPTVASAPSPSLDPSPDVPQRALRCGNDAASTHSHMKPSVVEIEIESSGEWQAGRVSVNALPPPTCWRFSVSNTSTRLSVLFPRQPWQIFDFFLSFKWQPVIFKLSFSKTGHRLQQNRDVTQFVDLSKQFSRHDCPLCLRSESLGCSSDRVPVLSRRVAAAVRAGPA